MADDDAGAVTATRDGAILHIAIDRASRRNALSHAMIDQFTAILTDAATDDGLRALHISGSGGDFCAGADLVAPAGGSTRPRSGDLVRRIPLTAHRVIELVHTIALPVVCTVRGYAVGLGCNLALAADFALADTETVFWEPFIERGFSPDSGSTWLLPRLVGIARARRMLLLGEKVRGDDAAEWGLIHDAVPGADLDTAAARLLDRLATAPTVAVGLAKQAINTHQHTTLTAAMTRELFHLELACRTADFKEGMNAFRDRRPPDFQGR